MSECRVQVLIVEPCPKCGSDKGWDGPVYQPADFIPGYREFPSRWIDPRLKFTCRTCGYSRTEPTKDAPPQPEVDVTVLRSPATPKKWWRWPWAR